MPTILTKPVRRTVEVAGRCYVVSLLPPTPTNPFPYIDFRQCRKRRSIAVPMESALFHAADRQRAWESKEKKRLKKLRQGGAV